jgi:hypothetical protein
VLLRFEILTAVKTEITVFCVVTPCSDVVRYRRFGGPCCFHLQGEGDRGSMDIWNVGIPTTMQKTEYWLRIFFQVHVDCICTEHTSLKSATTSKQIYVSPSATEGEKWMPIDSFVTLLSNGYQGLFPWGQSGRGVKLTTHLHLVPRSKNEWSYTSTPPIRLNGVVLS